MVSGLQTYIEYLGPGEMESRQITGRTISQPQPELRIAL